MQKKLGINWNDWKSISYFLGDAFLFTPLAHAPSLLRTRKGEGI